MNEAFDYFSILPALPEGSDSSGYKLLWQSVLMDCFDCRFSKSKEGRKQAKWDREWVLSTSEEVCSFEWLCQHLGLDPHVVRHAYLHRQTLVTETQRVSLNERAFMKAVEGALLALCDEMLAKAQR